MLWPGMRFSLRSQCKRCSAGAYTYMTSPQLAPTKRGRVGFTSESKALRTLRSRRDWIKSPPLLVPIQFLDVKTAAFILKFLGIPHGFVTNKSSLSHRYYAI